MRAMSGNARENIDTKEKRSHRKRFRWSFICGIMLFALGLISLFTGHYSQRLIKRDFSIKWVPARLAQRYIPLRSNKVEPSLNSGVREPINIWKSRYSKVYYGGSRRGPHFHDVVVVARILNATLVVPSLDHNSYWKDERYVDFNQLDYGSPKSRVSQISFIASLVRDVKIVTRVPEKVMRSMDKLPYTMRVPRRSTPEDYIELVLPILLRRRVMQLYKFDYRLANDLDPELQKLRCRVNYHSLRFTKPIQDVGTRVVLRMRQMAKRYIVVHLRFEPDMLAFSGCYYGGGEKEIDELHEIRKRWDTLPDLDPVEERIRGKCPLTPHEFGILLRALGFKNDTYVYVASGEIYGGEETLKPLRELFPNFYTKEILAGDELKPLLPFSSRLAVIDYIVCDESDVFVANNNGNMVKILAGRRRYMGHKRTIKPNAKRLVALFMAREKMKWDTFAKKVKSAQRGFMGEPDEMSSRKGDFHKFPGVCICKNQTKQSSNIITEAEDLLWVKSQLSVRGRSRSPTTMEDDEFLTRL